VAAPIKPKVRDDLAVVEIDGEAVIYDERTGHLHHLNPTATIVFALCDGQASIRELAEDVAEVFGLPVDDLERDIRTLVGRFRREGLLRPKAAPARG
jgi:PqqD family protein of HPr-rel-A system